jgi:crossover junction endonuclease MUS81
LLLGVRLPPLPAGVPFAQEYDIVLLVDNREQFAHGASGGRAQGMQEGMARLTQRGARRARCTRMWHVRACCVHTPADPPPPPRPPTAGAGVVAETRQLCIGDALWIARSRRPPVREFCLDFVVERKRLDDLESSIKDARYKQQKYFLKRCGLRHPVYLLEGDPNAAGALTGGGGEWRARAVKTAMLTTEVVDGFQVLRTPDMVGTFDTYSALTAALRALYATLSGPPAGAGGAAGASSVAAAAQAECPSFAQFSDAVAAVRREAKTVRALWGLMLTQLPGVGGDVAEAILFDFPTPSALRDAYAAAPSREAQRALLANLKTSAVKTIGPILSARIHAWVNPTHGGGGGGGAGGGASGAL